MRELVERERPHLIVPEIEAIATDELVRIEEEKLATVIPTARAAHITMNRERIRRLAAEELKLPVSPYAFASSLEELQAAIDGGIGYPCFVKPVMSSSGKGQSRLKSDDDVEKAWDKALSSGRVKQPRIIVEGEIKFDFEITQLTVRAADGKGGTATHFCDPIGHVQVDGDYVESWQPQPMSAKALRKSREIAEKITAALGGFGIFGVELFVKGDDVWFSEVSPRPHDTGLVTLVSQYQSEFALHARAILGFAGFDGFEITGRFRRRLWRHGCARHRLRRRRSRIGRSGNGTASVRQAGVLCEASHGCCACARQRRRRSARTREEVRVAGKARQGLRLHSTLARVRKARDGVYFAELSRKRDESLTR